MDIGENLALSHFGIIVGLEVTENQGRTFRGLEDALGDGTVAGNVFDRVAAHVGVDDDMLEGLNEMFVEFPTDSRAGLVQGVAPTRVPHWVFGRGIQAGGEMVEPKQSPIGQLKERKGSAFIIPVSLLS